MGFLVGTKYRPHAYPELSGDPFPAATLRAESGNSGAVHGFPGPSQLLAFGLGQEMQHYERRGLSILRAKCLRDGGRLQEKRNRTGILLRPSRGSLGQLERPRLPGCPTPPRTSSCSRWSCGRGTGGPARSSLATSQKHLFTETSDRLRRPLKTGQLCRGGCRGFLNPLLYPLRLCGHRGH